MRKFIVFISILFLIRPVFAGTVVETPIPFDETVPLQSSLTFDWFNKTQIERDENINQIRALLFNNKLITKYNKKEFKDKYAKFWKDEDFLKHYDEISKGVKEDIDKDYCGFYIGKLLIAYGIQYKNNLKNIYYYDAMGNLRWIDEFSPEYPNFPYYSYQYYRNGELAASYYYVSRYDQYVFNYDKTFGGRWFKEKMYNRKNKVIMTRTNW